MRGWLDFETRRLFEYRWPWRKSWVEKVATDHDLQPLLSRSGLVYLVRDESLTIPPVKRAKPRALLPIGLVFAAVAICSFVLVAPKQFASRPADESPSKATSETCEQQLADPAKVFGSWLAGDAIPGVEVSQLSQELLGGVQSKVVKVSCNMIDEKFQITLVLSHKTWQLNKVSRLEN